MLPFKGREPMVQKITGWAEAVRTADALQEKYPGWRFRAVRRREGPGIAAVRDRGRPCVLVGDPDEVRAALGARTGT
jgi:hypothetical protein